MLTNLIRVPALVFSTIVLVALALGSCSGAVKDDVTGTNAQQTITDTTDKAVAQSLGQGAELLASQIDARYGESYPPTLDADLAASHPANVTVQYQSNGASYTLILSSKGTTVGFDSTTRSVRTLPLR